MYISILYIISYKSIAKTNGKKKTKKRVVGGYCIRTVRRRRQCRSRIVIVKMSIVVRFRMRCHGICVCVCVGRGEIVSGDVTCFRETVGFFVFIVTRNEVVLTYRAKGHAGTNGEEKYLWRYYFIV